MRNLPKATVYFVRPNLHVTLTQDKWDIISELLLLQALQKYGFGNWHAIKDYLDYYAKNFSQKEIENHYKQFYIQGRKQPLLISYPLEIEHLNSFEKGTKKREKKVQYQQPQLSTIQGYNPKRNQYLFDYDPQAEELITDLQFLKNDTPQETQMKFKLLEEYNKRIHERRKREQFVQEHKLLCEDYQMEQLHCRKSKQDFRRKLSPFTRLLTFQESENVLNGLALQNTLKAEIRQLMTHRSRLTDPTFEMAYQSMKKIQQTRSSEHYRSASQLKVKQFKFQSKHQKDKVKRNLSEEEMIDKIKEIVQQKDKLQVTKITY